MSKQKDSPSTDDMLNDLLGPDFMSTGAGKPRPQAAAQQETVESESTQDPVEDDQADSAALEAQESTRRRRPRLADKQSQQKQEKNGIGAMVGAACLLGGIVATVLQGSGTLTTTLRSVGLDAPVLLTIGAVVFVLSIVRRQHALAQARYEQLAQAQTDKESDLQGSLQYLVEQQQLSAERPPAEGEELQRVLIALERQDEKVNNLSKALKMYGKPLMEIATQGNDIAAQVQQQKQQLEALQSSLMQGLAKIESASKALSVDLSPLEQKLAQMMKDLQTLQSVETHIASVAKRLDDNDMKQSLSRLEDSNKAYGQKLERLANQETVHEEMQRLERLVDTTVGKLTNTVDQVRDKDLGGLETSVKEIQREVSGLANSFASIQQALRSAPVAKPAPAMAAAAASTANETTHHEPAHAHAEPAHAAHTATAPAAAGASNDAQAGVAENRTGTRAASSKNVLGAIAKLKQMKG